jgi:Flp pilus assembly protein TadD
VLNSSLWLNHALAGNATWGYHVLNLSIHLLASLLLFGLVRRALASELFPESTRACAAGLAFTVAAVWMLHPLQTQSVTYVIQRAESLMGLFFMGTLYCALRSFDATRPGVWTAAAVGLCALGMATKEVMAAAPLVVLALDWTVRPGGLLEKLRRRKSLYGGLAATWAVLGALIATAPRSRSVGFELTVGAWEYLLTQAGVLTMYLRLSLIPYPQSFDYFDWPIAEGLSDVLLPGLLILSLLAATVWGLRRRHLVGLAGALFFLVLAPTSSVLPIVTEVVAEHRMYVPLAALVCLVVFGVHAQLERRGLRGVGAPLVLVALIAYGSLTSSRNRVYESAVALWQDVVDKRPGNAAGYDGLALALLEEGRLEEALPHAQRAVQLTGDGDFHANLGTVLNALGRVSESEAVLRRALETRPGDPVAYCGLGTSLARQERPEEALAAYRKALELDPRTPGLEANLAALHLLRGEIEQAVSWGRKAVERSPRDVQSRHNLGQALAQADDLGGAADQLQEACRLEPDNPKRHRKLAETFMQAGRLDLAAASYRRSLALEFLLEDANLLARILATHADPKVRNGAEAVRIAERMVAAAPREDAMLLDTLGTAYAEAGRFEEAAQAAERALQAPLPEGLEALVPEIRKRLELYRAGSAYHL